MTVFIKLFVSPTIIKGFVNLTHTTTAKPAYKYIKFSRSQFTLNTLNKSYTTVHNLMYLRRIKLQHLRGSFDFMRRIPSFVCSPLVSAFYFSGYHRQLKVSGNEEPFLEIFLGNRQADLHLHSD